MTEKELLDMATAIIRDFVAKVETGRARSVASYSECKRFLAALEEAITQPTAVEAPDDKT